MPSLKRVRDVTGLEVTLRDTRALKSFNEGISLLVCTRGDCVTPIEVAIEQDPEFIFAQLIVGCMFAYDASTAGDKAVSKTKEVIGKVKNWGKYNKREQLYLEAFKAALKMDIPKFESILREALVEHPTDVVALRLLLVLSISIGSFELLRDTVARVLPFWDKDNVFYPHVLSFYAFGLEETNCQKEAEDLCQRCISMQPTCVWAIHCFSHIVEETKDPKEGIDFLEKTRKNWEESSLDNHITWHLGLHYLDAGMIDKVYEEYDRVMEDRAVVENAFGLIDASSLLWRLELEGHNPGKKRWSRVEKAMTELRFTRGSPFLDLHVMLAFCHDRVNASTAKLAIAKEMIESLQDYTQSGTDFPQEVTRTLSLPVCQALLAFSEQKYSDVLSILLPLRYDWIRIGGSWAQRQVLFVTVIEAAIQDKNHKLALQLISELKALKPKSRKLIILFEKVQQLNRYSNHT